ncbi:MAG: hypothetical protein KAV18_01520, partial [Candidatus Omnitrophica bacterium]|nr:hypothetical protein [Candidatus Omnitrophota bacterium]
MAKIRVSDALELTNKAESPLFKLAPIINQMFPAGGEEFEVLTAETVKWNVTGALTNVKVDYSIDGGANYDYVISASTPAGGGSDTIIPWNITDTPSPNVIVRVSDPNDSSINDVSPQLSIKVVFDMTSPLTNWVWEVGTPEDIIWST